MLNLHRKCQILNIQGHFYPFFFNTTYRMAAFAAVSFAEGITFGAWLRALAAPVANDGDETIAVGANSWGWGARTARLDVSAVAPDGNAGFNMHVFDDMNNGLSMGDEAILWVKPMEMVKVSYGKHENNVLRGDACYGSWNWMRPNDAWIDGGEGYLMSHNHQTGLMAEVTPMEGLYVQLFAPINTNAVKAGTVYKNLQAGFAYTVPGTVKIKGQYIGKGASSTDGTPAQAATTGKWVDKNGDDYTYTGTTVMDYFDAVAAGYKYIPGTPAVAAADGADGNSNCTLEAEVDVLAVEGLSAGVGFQYNIVKDGNDKAEVDDDGNPVFERNMKVALAASYQVMPELKVSASGAFYTFYKYADVKIDPRFDAGVGIDYDLGDGLAANADFRYSSPIKVDGEKVDDTDHMAFSVGVVKSVSSNGSIGVAFQGITNSGSLAGTADGTGVIGKTKDGDVKFVWAVPVALSVWF